jgi:hypothetical protein
MNGRTVISERFALACPTTNAGELSVSSALDRCYELAKNL